jgi:hypothetical protein
LSQKDKVKLRNNNNTILDGKINIQEYWGDMQKTIDGNINNLNDHLERQRTHNRSINHKFSGSPFEGMQSIQSLDTSQNVNLSIDQLGKFKVVKKKKHSPYNSGMM